MNKRRRWYLISWAAWECPRQYIRSCYKLSSACVMYFITQDFSFIRTCLLHTVIPARIPPRTFNLASFYTIFTSTGEHLWGRLILITNNFYPVKKVKIFCIFLISSYIFKLLVSYSQWLLHQPERATLAMICYLLVSDRLCLSKKRLPFTYSVCTHRLTASPEMLTSSRKGCHFCLSTRIKASLFPLVLHLPLFLQMLYLVFFPKENTHIRQLF